MRSIRSGWPFAPTEVLGLVLQGLDSRDRQSFRLCCRAWLAASKETLIDLKPKALITQTAESFPSISYLDLCSCKPSAALESLLPAFGYVTHLAVTNASFLQHASLARLQQLDIEGDADYATVDAIFRHLHIKQLRISDWRSFDQSIQELLLKAQPALVGLDVDRGRESSWCSRSNQAHLSCQALTKLSSLQSLCLGTLIDLSPESLEGLLNLTALKQLSFAHSGKYSLSKTAVQVLAQLTSLTELRILMPDTPGYDNAALPGWDDCLANLTNLQSLALTCCCLDGVDLNAGLSNLNALTALDVSRSLILNLQNCLEALPLEQLHSLTLQESRCSPEHLLPLKRATNLQHLDLSRCVLDYSSEIQHEQIFEGMQKLRSLCMSHTSVIGDLDGFANTLARSLGGLTSLVWLNENSILWASACLDLEACSRVGTLLRHADQLSSLRRLDLREQSLAPAHATLRSIGSIVSLTELDLSHTICEEGADFDSLLIHLRGLENLQRLSLESTATSSKGLAAIGFLTELTSLNLSCAPLQEDSLPHLRFLQKLRELFLNSWNLEHCISDAGMAHLSLLLNLERLSMRSNWHISNAGLKPLLKLPWLAYLDLRGGLHIHAESALRQLKACTSLEELRLSEPGDHTADAAVSASALHALKTELPYLRSVTIGGEVITSKAACTMASIQHKMRVAALELAKACLLVLDVYEAAKTRFAGVEDSITIGAV